MEVYDLPTDVTVLTEEDKHSIALEQAISIMQERIAELEFATEDKEWQRLWPDSKTFELSKGTLDKIVARSRLYYLVNPLIHRAVSLQSDYVFAQGLNIQATDADVNQVVQYFLDDKQNNKEISGHQARLLKEQTLMLDGNVFLVLFTDTMSTGRVQVRSILVDEITDIICNPDDQNEVWYYKREWQSVGIDGIIKHNVTLHPDIDYIPDNKPFNIKSAAGENITVLWGAPIYHIKVGALAKSKFGVPEVYAALDWAQAHRKFLEDWVTIVRSYAQFAFKVTTKGGRNAVTAARQRLGTTVSTANSVDKNPKAVTGSAFITTKDGADIEPIKTAGATTSAQDGREIRMMVAAALGIPDTFFGDVDVGNLATARTLDRPTELKYRSRQTMWQEVYKNILSYVIKWAVLAPKGPLKDKIKLQKNIYGVYTLNIDELTGENVDTHIEINFPPILEHSIQDRITAITDAITLNGKSFAVDSIELQKLTIRLMLQALGLSDVDELVNKIFKEMDTNNADSVSNNNDTTDGVQ